MITWYLKLLHNVSITGHHDPIITLKNVMKSFLTAAEEVEANLTKLLFLLTANRSILLFLFTSVPSVCKQYILNYTRLITNWNHKKGWFTYLDYPYSLFIWFQYCLKVFYSSRSSLALAASIFFWRIRRRRSRSHSWNWLIDWLRFFLPLLRHMQFY